MIPPSYLPVAIKATERGDWRCFRNGPCPPLKSSDEGISEFIRSPIKANPQEPREFSE